MIFVEVSKMKVVFLVWRVNVSCVIVVVSSKMVSIFIISLVEVDCNCSSCLCVVFED